MKLMGVAAKKRYINPRENAPLYIMAAVAEQGTKARSPGNHGIFVGKGRTRQSRRVTAAPMPTAVAYLEYCADGAFSAADLND